MSDGFYKCTDTAITTKDWVKLSFDSIPTAAIVKLCGENVDWLERLNPEMKDCPECGGSPDNCPVCAGEGTVEDSEGNTEMCADCDGQGVEELDPDNCSECDGTGQVLDDEAYLHGWPVAWGTMYQADENPNVAEFMDQAGFTVYRPDDETELEGLLFGLDSGGYCFYEAHWIPLRALICIHCCTYLDQKTRLIKALQFLENEVTGIAGGVESFRRRFGEHYVDTSQDQPSA